MRHLRRYSSVSTMARGSRHAVALLGYIGLALLVFQAAWKAPSTTIVGVGGDPQLSIWFIKWVPFALTHGYNPLLTDWLDYPEGVNLMWNTSAPLLSLVLWPITERFGPNVAYNLAQTLALASSAWVAYLVFGRYVRSSWAAALGGVLFGFSPYMISHALGHPALTVLFTVPLMLVLLDDILVRQQRPAVIRGALLGLVAAIQLLISEQVLLAEGMIALAGIAVLATPYVNEVRRRAAYALRALVAAFAVFLLLTAAPLAVQLFGPSPVYGRAWPANSFVSDLLSFIVPSRLQAVAPAAAVQVSDHFSANIYEWSAYLGIPLLGLLGFAAWRYRNARLVRFLTLLIGFTALLSMGPLVNIAGHKTPVPVALLALLISPVVVRATGSRGILWAFLALWAAMVLVPVADDLLPGRLTLFLFLFAGLLLAVLLDQAQGLRPLEAGRFEPALLTARQRASILAVTVLAAVLLLPRQPYPTTVQVVPSFLTPDLMNQIPPGSVALVAPFAYDWRLADAMHWQLESGMRFRMPEGFAWIPGPTPFPRHSALGDAMADVATGKAFPAVTASTRPAFLDDLHRWQVKTVLVAPMAHQREMIELFTSLLGRPPISEGGAAVWLPGGTS